MSFADTKMMMQGASGAGGYVIENAIWLDGSADYLSWTPSGNGNRKTYSVSAWIKRTYIGGNQYVFSAFTTSGLSTPLYFQDGTDSKARSSFDQSLAPTGDQQTNAEFRDTTAWFHYLKVVDTTVPNQWIYINGVEQTYAVDNNPTLNDENDWNEGSTPHAIGCSANGITDFFNGYLAEVIHLDGYAATPSDFGETDANGNWVPIDPTSIVTAQKGTNGFWLKFSDANNLGKNFADENTKDFYENLTDESLHTNCVLCLDAGDSTSYTSGQDWVDLSAEANADEFHRGATTGSEASDPTFNGTAGDLSHQEYFSFDGGDYFTYGSGTPETWMSNMHKDNATWSFAGWVYVPAGNNTDSVIWGNEGTNDNKHGVELYIDIGQKLDLYVRDGATPASLTVNGDTALTLGAWNFIGVSLDEAGGNVSFLYQNGDYDQVSASNTFDAAYSAPSSSAPSHAMQIGADGNSGNILDNGFRIAGIMFWDVALTKANMDSIYAATKKRFIGSFDATSMSSANQVTDTPTDDAVNDVGNYCGLDPINPTNTGDPSPYIFDANLRHKAGGINPQDVYGSMKIPPSGVWQMECEIVAAGSTPRSTYFGFVDYERGLFSSTAIMSRAAEATNTNSKKVLDSTESGTYDDWDDNNVVCGMVYDVDADEVKCYVDGVLQWTESSASTYLTGNTIIPYLVGGDDTDVEVNFGQRNGGFQYPVTGAKPLCTANFQAPDVKSADDVIATANDTEDNIEATLDAAHSFTGTLIEIFGNRSTAENRLVQFTDDDGNSLDWMDGTAAKAALSLSGSDNWTAVALAASAANGIYTAAISHTNGSDTNQPHGLSSTNGRFAALLRGEASGQEWYLDHPDLTSGYNIRPDRGGTEGEQNGTVYVSVDATNVTVKSAAPTGTFRVIVFAETGVCQLYNFKAKTDIKVITDNSPKFLMWFGKTVTGGGYGHQTAWEGTHNPYNPWKASFDLYIATAAEETATNGADMLANGYKIREALQSNWQGSAGDVHVGISIGQPLGGDGVAQARAR